MARTKKLTPATEQEAINDIYVIVDKQRTRNANAFDDDLVDSAMVDIAVTSWVKRYGTLQALLLLSGAIENTVKNGPAIERRQHGGFLN